MMPASSAQWISSVNAAAVIMVPLGLAGEATTTPFSGLVRCVGKQRLAGNRPTRRRACFDPHRLAAQRRQDVAVGRISGQRHRDAVSGLESGEECQNEAGRRAGSDDDPRRIDVDPVPFAISPRDSPRSDTVPSVSV